ncbi:MAG: putative Ig domain-containing protein, partial [Gammaproteobacteria bacterium]|nr:putative Ig domain-containing protein [Gammaproteobacteria bacterium]
PTDPTDPTEPTDPGPTDPEPTDPEPVNTAPVISGTPPTSVVQDTQYRFVPNASDADGDVLTFSIANAPSWASFDASNGELRGTPGAGDVGTYSDIRISVTDGAATAELAPFSIDVEAVAMGTATLSWTAPTQRTDGSALTDLTGYRVYSSTDPDDLGSPTDIDNAGITTYVVENLTSGTWYFAVTAVDSSGLESDFSNVASKTIP